MTIGDAYKLYQQMADEQDGAYLSPPMFVRQYIVSRRAWLRDKASQPDSEYVRRLTAAFWKEEVVRNTATFVLLGLGEFSFIRAVSPDFDLNGKKLSNRPCPPVTDDQFSTVMTDPTKRPDDWFPRYREEGDRLSILSKTVPTVIRVTYWQDLDEPVFTSVFASELAESKFAVDEILLRVLAKADLATGDVNRYAAVTGREIPAENV
ncbi:hypothetical protein [Spirosoma sordidisoli]|uniref:Uncharacterized protein n=1 Tax=Spirosoma sordidisoli TaxID=2502893 RepID=A0A4Q2USD7_9BACT|nr:hypothetical protein [Spirosoma sordidisoli]RYC70665.1 hypothetical protein EQG79_00505 [Spirosoma sordidisoli]